MQFKIEFQYKSAVSERPEDCVQDDDILPESGQFVPLPDVGDSVSYSYGKKRVARKVLSRHFSYTGELCIVNIVVTDMPSSEMTTRLKE